LVEADEYAAEITRYIHLNPVKAGMVGKPLEFLECGDVTAKHGEI